MVLRVASEIERYICELGNEGRLISMQLEELLDNIENDEILIIEDYMEGGKYVFKRNSKKFKVTFF